MTYNSPDYRGATPDMSPLRGESSYMDRFMERPPSDSDEEERPGSYSERLRRGADSGFWWEKGRKGLFQREGYSRIDYRDVVSVSRNVGDESGYNITKMFTGDYKEISKTKSGKKKQESMAVAFSLPAPLTASQFGASLTASFLGKN